MGLPVVYLVGLLALFAAHEFSDSIPGGGELGALATIAPLLLLPPLFVLLALRAVRMRIRGRRPLLDPELLLRLSTSLSPVAVFLVSTFGGWGDFVWQLAGDSHTVGLLLAGAPLFATELPRMVLATQASAWLEVEADPSRAGRSSVPLPAIGDLAPILRLRLGWVVIVSMPWLVLGISVDLLSLSRPVYALTLGTSFGMTGGFLVLLVAVAIALPIGFRSVFGATRRLPEPAGHEVRKTAMALGFDPKQIYLLPTGMSAVNAMMVGPLSASRCLCITDGLVHVLDPEALCGVIAHEVGHARMGHPGLLVLLAVILPLMLMQPFGLMPLDDLAPGWQIAIGLGITSLLWLVVRSLAHRFELEADIASVRALGAGPCSRALLAVSHATFPVRRHLIGRLATLHPDESTRLMTMARYEREAEFRVRFDGTGRRLRVTIIGAVALAIGAALWAWSTDWPFERAIWRFHSGDIVSAQAERDAIGADVPERWLDTWALFERELDAAAAMAPEATDWSAARSAWDRLAFDRGVGVLLSAGPADATSWFALAADSASPRDDDYLLSHQLFEFCRAVRDGDAARVEAIRQVILRRPVPPRLAPAFE